MSCACMQGGCRIRLAPLVMAVLLALTLAFGLAWWAWGPGVAETNAAGAAASDVPSLQIQGFLHRGDFFIPTGSTP